MPGEGFSNRKLHIPGCVPGERFGCVERRVTLPSSLHPPFVPTLAVTSSGSGSGDGYAGSSHRIPGDYLGDADFQVLSSHGTRVSLVKACRALSRISGKSP